MIKIVVVDDHPLIREGLIKLLSIDENFEIMGQGDNGKKALALVEELSPDILLLDVNMPEMDGIETLKELKKLTDSPKILMLTAYDDRKHLKDCIHLGADGYILKDSEYDVIINAIKTLYKDRKYIQPELSSYLVDSYDRNYSIDNIDSLTKREFEILLLISDGLSNLEIADNLYISEKTVKNHISNLYEKLELRDRAHAIIFVYDNNLK